MDVERWSRDAASNGALPPDGFPENQTRRSVNDAAREVMAAVKRFYDAPDMRNPFANFTLTRTSGTNWILTDGGGQTNAGQFLEVGQRIRMTRLGSTWEGFIATLAAYGAPNQAFGIEWLPAPESADLSGPPSATSVVMVVGPKELGRAAWYDTGPGANQIPLTSDIKPYAISTDEDDLNVGFVNGLTSQQIAAQALRGRINPNGGLNVWSRGVSFSSGSTPNNDSDNVIADNWTLLSDGNNRVEITRDNDVPPGIPVRFSMKLAVSAGAGANQKHGVITFAELEDAIDLGRSDTINRVSFSFWARQGAVAGVKGIRAYLLNLKNSVPSTTPVSGWGSGTEGSNVTLNGADWEIVPGGVLPCDFDAIGQTWTEFKLENLNAAAAGSGAMALLFAVDDASFASPASWHLAAAQINRGATALPFLPLPIALERTRLARYYENTFDDEASIYPAAALGSAYALAARNVNVNQPVVIPWRFRVAKFKVPTVVLYNPRTAVANPYSDMAASDLATGSATASRQQVTLISAATAAANTTYYVAAAAHANIWGNG